MGQPNIQQVFSDPDFQGLPPAEQMKVVGHLDPDFAGLPSAEQAKALVGLHAKFGRSDYPQLPAVKPPNPPEPSFGERHPYLSAIAGTVGDFVTGATKSASQTVFHPSPNQTLDTSYAVGKGLEPAPSRTFTPSRQITPQEYAATQPEGTAQKVGAGAEQFAEMMATGGPLRSLATRVGGRAGVRAVPALARMGAEAANTGGSAYLHGQDVPTAALLGGATGGLSELAQAIAPKIAEGALGTRFSERMYGRNPGAAIINNTSGITPDAVGKSAREMSLRMVSQLEGAANAASARGVTVSTQPALDIIDREIATAARENNANVVAQLREARNQLTRRFDTGAAIPQNISPTELLDLKRGFGDTVTNWGKIAERQGVSGVLKQAYRALDSEFDRAVPAAAQTNQVVSSLMGIARDAERRAVGPGVIQGMVGRMRAHTGALAGTLTGGALGYKQGGWSGAAEGAALGMVLPELIGNPSAQMALARASNAAPVINRAIPPIILQMMKKSH